MSTKPFRLKVMINRNEKTNETALQSDYPALSTFLRGRDPDAIAALFSAMEKRRTLLSWLTPGTAVKGVPAWAGPPLPWLTFVDDLVHEAAAGPDSFDKPSLEWWINNRALALIREAAVFSSGRSGHVYRSDGRGSTADL